jgi:hypothetical protein
MSTTEYILYSWMESYEGIYTLIIINCILWLGYIVKDGIMNKEHLK